MAGPMKRLDVGVVGLLTLVLLQWTPAYALNLNFGGIDLNQAGSLVSNAADATTDVSEEKERQIGQGVAANLLGAAPLVDDNRVQVYVNRVGLWIAAQTERSHLDWRFGVLESSNVNAFATPGGFVFITKGLFLLMNNEAELAGVLAHEIAHVLRRHHLEAIKKKAQVGMLANMLTMAVGEHGAAVGQLAQVGTHLYAQGLDQEDEFQADVVGIVLAARAGYDPYGLLSALATLGDIKPDDNSMALMNTTHPAIGDRLARLETLEHEGIDDAQDARRLEERFARMHHHVLRRSGFERIK